MNRSAAAVLGCTLVALAVATAWVPVGTATASAANPWRVSSNGELSVDVATPGEWRAPTWSECQYDWVWNASYLPPGNALGLYSAGRTR